MEYHQFLNDATSTWWKLFSRIIRISSHCWWYSHIWPGHYKTCRPRQSFPTEMCWHEHYPKHGEMQIPSNWSVIFAGFCLSAEGYRINTSITDAIHKFPTPTSCSDLRSFLGWQTSYLHATLPWHCCWLLCAHCSVQRMIFLWKPHHEDAFVKTIGSLITAPTLSFFAWTSPYSCALMQADKV